MWHAVISKITTKCGYGIAMCPLIANNHHNSQNAMNFRAGEVTKSKFEVVKFTVASYFFLADVTDYTFSSRS